MSQGNPPSSSPQGISSSQVMNLNNQATLMMLGTQPVDPAIDSTMDFYKKKVGTYSQIHILNIFFVIQLKWRRNGRTCVER